MLGEIQEIEFAIEAFRLEKEAKAKAERERRQRKRGIFVGGVSEQDALQERT
jgi:hypothetical protein